MEKRFEVLKTYFGYDSFRPGQEEIVDAILAGRDALAVMPTGAGKSLCFQLPALLLPGITLVVSPLISLMKDQVQSLVQAGVPAAYLNSTLSQRQFELALDNARYGKYKIVYVAPERLLTPSFLAFAQGAQISLLAVDEAHCVSQWGQDFRPSYLDVPRFLEALPRRPVLAAFTATATPTVRADMARLLELRDPVESVTGFDRKNLYFEVRTVRRKTDVVLDYVRAHPGESGVIYCATRKNVEAVCAALQAAGVPATRYHAGLPAQERQANQEDFSFDRRPVIVATNAFGMGIDKSNVRYVLHYNMPKDMESYYQEAGRAGRDGEPAECVLLFSPQDVMTARFLIEQERENKELDEETLALVRERDYKRLQRMEGYCRTEGCLRQYILGYFGETAEDTCGGCYNCLHSFRRVDITEDAQKILSCVKRTGERFGQNVIIQVLRGKENERITQWGLDRQSTFGLMKELKGVQIKARIQAMLQDGCLAQSEGKFPLLRLGPRSGDVLFRGGTCSMRAEDKDALAEPEPGEKKTRAQGEPPEGLFQRLRALRTVLARERDVPAYVIFSDAALKDMALKCPRTQEAFLEVSGVGQKKLEQYGEIFMDEIAAYLARG